MLGNIIKEQNNIKKNKLGHSKANEDAHKISSLNS